MRIKPLVNASLVSGSITTGVEVELPDDLAQDLIRAKFAVDVKPKPKQELKPKPTEVTPIDVLIEPLAAVPNAQ